jgi:hypothetical protein
MRALTRCVVMLLLTNTCWVAAAQAPQPSVDQVLATLAEVIRDQAKRAAAEAVLAQVQDSICAGEPVKVGEAVLVFGGTDACRRAKPDEAEGLCTSDHVFVQSCRLAALEYVRLTDTYFLKTIAKDTIRFAVRASNSHLSATRYSAARLDAMAEFVADMMESTANPGLAPAEVLEPLLQLADSLRRKLNQRDTLADVVLGEVARLPQSLAAAQKVTRLVDNVCHSPMSAEEAPLALCAMFRTRGAFMPLVSDAGLPERRSRQCRIYISEASRSMRETNFLAHWYVEGVFRDARHRSCGELPSVLPVSILPLDKRLRDAMDSATMNVGEIKDQLAIQAREVRGSERLNCHLGQLIRVVESIYRAACEEDEAERLAATRSLALVLWSEWPAFTGSAMAFRDAPVGPAITSEVKASAAAAATALADFRRALLDRLRTNGPKVVAAAAHEELVTASLAVAYALRAEAKVPEATSAWVSALTADLSAVASEQDITAFFRMPSLEWRFRGALKPDLKPLRDAVKAFLYTPVFVYALESRGQKLDVSTAIASARDLANAMVALVHSLKQNGTEKESTRSLVRKLAAVLVVVARAEDDLAERLSARPDEQDGTNLKELAQSLRSYASTFRRTSDLLRQVADREWGAMTITASRFLDENALGAAPGRVLSFSRILLTVYQAKSPDEAKAIFNGALEERGSRRLRYTEWSVDLGGIFAGRGGHRWIRDSAVPEHSDGAFGGLYVPFGVQIAKRWGGLILYPLDLGTYLTAADKQNAPPQWSDAVRGGIGLEVRLSSRFPVVFGMAADYRPRFESREETRLFGYVGIEVPLFLIK